MRQWNETTSGEVQVGHRERVLQRWLWVTGTGSPGKLSWHQASQNSECLDNALSSWFRFREFCEEQGVGLDLYESLPIGDILGFCDCVIVFLSLLNLQNYHHIQNDIGLKLIKYYFVYHICKILYIKC